MKEIENLSVSASACRFELENNSETSICVSGSVSMSGNSSLLSMNSSNDPKLSKPKFDFLYKRTCFRLMSEYYKYLFQQSVAKGKKVARNFKKLMNEFCKSDHIAPFLERLPSK